MRIYLEDDGEELGPFGRERVLHGLRSGKWPPDTRARTEDTDRWTPLGELLAGEPSPGQPAKAAETSRHAPPAPAQRPKERREPGEAPVYPRFKAIFLLLLIGVVVYLYTMERRGGEPAPRSFESDPPEWMAAPQWPVPNVLPPPPVPAAEETPTPVPTPDEPWPADPDDA